MARSLFLLKLLLRTGLARHVPSLQRFAEGGIDVLHHFSDEVLRAPRAELADADALHESPPPDMIDLSCPLPRFDGISLNLNRTGDRRGWPPPWGLPELRKVIGYLDEVLITQGATGALRTILDAFVNSGDGVVLLDPTSPLFSLALRTHGARPRWLLSWLDKGWTRFKFTELDRALRGAKLLLLSSPSNPNGGLFTPDDLEQLAWWADKRDVLIVNDESFAPFVYEGEHVSIASREKAQQRTLTIGSVSKSHGLSALRVGWIKGNRHLLRACQLSASLRQTVVPTACQQAALAALRQPHGPLEALVHELAARRRYACERLQTMGLQPSWPLGGWHFWIPVWERGVDGRTFAHRLLNEHGVQVTPGDLFGPSGTGHVRLSFAGDDGRLREGLRRVGDFLGVHRPQLKIAA